MIAGVLLIAFTMAVATLVGPFFTDVIQTSQDVDSSEDSFSLTDEDWSIGDDI